MVSCRSHLVVGKSMMLLSQRNPSVNWEPVPVDQSRQLFAWAWFRPAAIPTGMMLLVPAALFADSTTVAGLSLRRVVAATGLDPSQIICWTVNGMNFDAMGGTSVLLDQILPSPPNGVNLEVSVWMGMAAQPAWPVVQNYPAQYQAPAAAAAVPYAGSISPEDELLLAAIED